MKKITLFFLAIVVFCISAILTANLYPIVEAKINSLVKENQSKNEKFPSRTENLTEIIKMYQDGSWRGQDMFFPKIPSSTFSIRNGQLLENGLSTGLFPDVPIGNTEFNGGRTVCEAHGGGVILINKKNTKLAHFRKGESLGSKEIEGISKKAVFYSMPHVFAISDGQKFIAFDYQNHWKKTTDRDDVSKVEITKGNNIIVETLNGEKFRFLSSGELERITGR